MARATLKEVEPVKRPVLLELSPEEAESLMLVVSLIGDNSKVTRPGDVDAIYIALRSVGVVRAKAEHTGIITFQ